MTTTPLRKDAARNWDRIVDVARALVDQGTPLQLNDVARRAGLGVGTVYRHFATPEALLETVATPCLEALAAHGEQALADTDPWRALEGFLTRTVEAQVTDASLAPVTAASEDTLPRTTELKQSLRSAGTTLLDRPAGPGRYVPTWPRRTSSRSCAASPTRCRSTAAPPMTASTQPAAIWPPCSGVCGPRHRTPEGAGPLRSGRGAYGGGNGSYRMRRVVCGSEKYPGRPASSGAPSAASVSNAYTMSGLLPLGPVAVARSR